MIIPFRTPEGDFILEVLHEHCNKGNTDWS
jgi:hypothetical protein